MFLFSWLRAVHVWAGLSCLALTGSLGAGEPAGKCVEVSGSLLGRSGAKNWKATEAGDSLPADTLLIALPEAELVSANGAVGIRMTADIGKRGPFPVLESAITLHPAKDC